MKKSIKLSKLSNNSIQRKFEYNDFIILKPNAEVILSGTPDKSPPKKYLEDNGLWAIDYYEPESGMLNISRVETPYPGAFCSWVHEDDVEKIIRDRK